MRKEHKKMIKENLCKIISIKKYFRWDKLTIIPTKASVPEEFNAYTSISSLVFVSFFIISGIIHFGVSSEYWSISLIVLSIFEMLFFFLVYSRRIWLGKVKSSKDWFEKIGYEILAIRFHVLKNNKWHGLEFLIFIIMLLIISPYVFEPLFKEDQEYLIGFRGIIFSLIWLPFIMIFSNLIFRARFYYDYFSNYFCAKGCIMMINTDETLEDEHKIRILKFGLEFYNNFLKMSTGFQIKNQDAIYSSIACELKRPADVFYKEFLKTFDNEETFKPLSYLASNLNETESLNMLTSFKYSDKFKIGTKQFVPIILVFLAVLNIVFGIGNSYTESIIKYISQFIPKISFA